MRKFFTQNFFTLFANDAHASYSFEDIGHLCKHVNSWLNIYGDLDGYVAPKVDESNKGGNGGSNMGIFLVAGVVIAAQLRHQFW